MSGMKLGAFRLRAGLDCAALSDLGSHARRSAGIQSGVALWTTAQPLAKAESVNFTARKQIRRILLRSSSKTGIYVYGPDFA